jgi:ATP-dependent Clp endopeptidase proteolytic subunit ClpP
MLFNKSRKKVEGEHDHDEEVDEVEEKTAKATMPMTLFMPPAAGGKDDSRTIGLFGEVEEAKISQIVGVMLDLAENCETEYPSNPDDPESEILTENEPIEFIINTPGGSADDMFALYDIMRVIKNKCDIVTFGVGKVMSAGVLLLAAGTKGQRRIGKNCRVMIHSVIGGNAGPLHNLENEMDEIRYVQSAYLKALAAETNMSFRQLKKMIDKKVNVYLSAEEAVKLGIADIIV